MKNFNLLSKMCSPLVGSQSSEVGFDCRLTVGSPSFDCRSAMLKLVSVLALIFTLGVGQAWGADATMTGVSNATASTVNKKTAFKCATGSKAGSMKVTVPTGANVISFYCAGWNGKSVTVSVTPTDKVNTTSFSPTSDSGISGSGTSYTLSGTESTYLKTITLKSITASTDITFSTSKDKQFVLWGAKYCFNPTSPTNGTIGSATARLSWTDTHSVGYYELYYSKSSTAPTMATAATVTDITNTYADLISLDASATYYWWVRAYDNYCKSEWVAGSSFTTTSGASCSADPTIGTASLNGLISLSSLPVQTTGWTVGANCEWADFGFVWSSTVSTPTLESNGTASANCTKIQKATSGTATSTSHSITGTFNTSTSYYVRGYGKNRYASGTYQYTDVLTITPRSVEFNSNGGSAVATKYVNSGTKVSAPDAPTKTGYNFGEWQLNSSEFDFANINVTSNITLVATWTAKTTTISFNQTSGTGGQTGTLTATYDAAMPSAPVTVPTRDGYDFGGYYDGSGGTGTQYYTNTGASARNWDKEDATYTLHAKWTLKSYTVTWKVNNENYSAGGSSSVTHGNHITTLPTAPNRPTYGCGDVFVGWTNVQNYVHGTSPLYTTAAEFPNATGDQVFYAVYADYTTE